MLLGAGGQERCGLNLSFDACMMQWSFNQNLLMQSGSLSTFVARIPQFSVWSQTVGALAESFLRRRERTLSHLRAVAVVVPWGHHGLTASRAPWSILTLAVLVLAHDGCKHSQADSEQSHRSASQDSDKVDLRTGTIELPGQDAIRGSSSTGDLPLVTAVQGDVLEVCSPIVLSPYFPSQ